MMSTQLSQIAKKAKLDRTVRFTSLARLLTPEFLTETWGMMNRRAASGIDGESTEQFESELKQRVEEICAQLRAGAHRAPPVRRVEIPKGPRKTGTRHLGIPTVADRLLQRAVARIIEAVFEADFLDCSYGFRPGRNPHDALQALQKVRFETSADTARRARLLEMHTAALTRTAPRSGAIQSQRFEPPLLGANSNARVLTCVSVIYA
jgi:RNA-directed DNA polymerase